MQYAKVENRTVTQVGLPEVATLKDGRTVSGFDLLDAAVLKDEGWLPMVDGTKPDFDPGTQHLQGSYDVQEDAVVVNYTTADNPVVEPAVDLKAQAIESIESATTIAGLRAAMLKYINA